MNSDPNSGTAKLSQPASIDPKFDSIPADVRQRIAIINSDPTINGQGLPVSTKNSHCRESPVGENTDRLTHARDGSHL
ncbi:MAG: hypothetical protein R3C09_04945 [Pirellulaceae bacterium]